MARAILHRATFLRRLKLSFHIATSRMPPSLAPYNALLPESVSTPTLVDANDVPTENGFKQTIESAEPASLGQGVISWYWKNWKYESAACLLVLSGPLVIFGTLYPHNGQPLPQWPFDVSINSLLSVYTLILKASIGIILGSCIGQLQWKWFALESRPLYDMVRFDQATRDAGGALNLIWRQRIQQPLTTLGCAITILAVAVDPFVQQLLRPVDCSIGLPDDDMTADLPVATFFSGWGHFGPSDNNTPVSAKKKAIEKALYTGTFAPQQDILWQCPTGNCTFSIYSTIGLCNSCEDVSSDVVVNFTHSLANVSEHGPPGAPPTTKFTVVSSYNTSEHISMSVNMSATQWLGGPVSVAVAAAEQHPSMSANRDDIRDAKFVFGFLVGATVKANGRIDWTTTDNSTCNPEAVNESWSCRGYGAATCTIKPCIQVYNATVTAGTFEENLLQTMSGADWGRIRETDTGGDMYLAMLDSKCASQERTDSFPDSELKDRWRPFDFNLTESDTAQFAKSLPENILSLIETGCLHLVSPTLLFYSVGQYLQGFVQATPGSSMHQADDFEILDMGNFQGPPVIQSIYNWGNTDFERVESTLTNITDSLTTYIRTHSWAQSSDGKNYTRTTKGIVYHYATCLEVKWLWLLFPSAMSSLTLLLFFLVIEIARKENAPVWKASPLAWVLRTDGPADGRFSFSGGAYEAMQDRSRQIAVQLDEVDGPRIGMVDMKDPHLELR